MKTTARLENWKYDDIWGYGKNMIWGDIYGDTKGRFPDGVTVHTSRVLKVQDGFAHTLNSVYQLGEPA